MDHYTAERLFLERRRELEARAERRARLAPAAGGMLPRVWVAGRLRALADRLDGQPHLLRA